MQSSVVSTNPALQLSHLNDESHDSHPAGQATNNDTRRNVTVKLTQHACSRHVAKPTPPMFEEMYYPFPAATKLGALSKTAADRPSVRPCHAASFTNLSCCGQTYVTPIVLHIKVSVL